MRTTISISDALLTEVKERAQAEGQSVSSYIEAALRLRLAGKKKTTCSFKLVTFRGGGVKPGIDLDKVSALIELDDIDQHGCGNDST